MDLLCSGDKRTALLDHSQKSIVALFFYIVLVEKKQRWRVREKETEIVYGCDMNPRAPRSLFSPRGRKIFLHSPTAVHLLQSPQCLGLRQTGLHLHTAALLDIPD